MNQSILWTMNRRASLLTLGATGLAAIASPITSDAKKNHGKNKGKKADVNKRCKQQAAAWTTFVTIECDGDPDCLELGECATPLKSCDFGGFLACITAAGQSMSRPAIRGTAGIAGPLGHAGTNQKRSS